MCSRFVEASISLQLSDEDAAALRARAALLRLEPEQLAAAVLHGQRYQHDPAFEAPARRIVEKNRELYSRLA
ncbi:MAG: hypothetical protein FJ137_08370 [Deltaproteobacteria bacterium]|nr:hypothetical protein [Deltaproteobacteria bacterium]